MRVAVELFKKYYFGLMLLMLGLHTTFFQIYGYQLKYIIGDMGDARFIASIIEYNYQWLLGTYHNYWDGFFMFPDKEVISYSDNLLGSLPFYAIIRFCGVPFLTAYQLLMLVFHILNFVSAYWFFNKVTQNKYAAAAGAFVFAFSIVLCGIHNHTQFIFRFCIPACFYFLNSYLSNKRFKDLFYAIFFLIFQFYLGVYIGYFLLLFVGLYSITHSVFNRHSQVAISWNTRLLQLFAALLFFAAGILPILYFYYKRMLTQGYFTDYAAASETFPRLSSYFKSFPNALSWKFLNNTEVSSNYGYFHFLFPGTLVFLTIIYSIYLVIKRKDRGYYLSILSLLLVVVIVTTMFKGHSLLAFFYEYVPGFKTIRIVSRMVVVAMLFPAWLISRNVSYLLGRNFKFGFLIIIILPFALFLDNYVPAGSFGRTLKQESVGRMNDLETKLKQNPNYKDYLAFAYIPDASEESYIVQIDAMLTALDMKTKTVNGYSSACNNYFWSVWLQHDSASIVNWCRAMHLNPSKVQVIK